MKALIAWIVLLFAPVVATVVPVPERPVANIPPSARQQNWLGSQREGSCVHATTIMALRWQGMDATASFWKATYGNGEGPAALAAKMDRAGIRYAYTSRQNDVAFLERALASRRPCGVTVQGAAHMILLVHLDAKVAILLDNNSIGKFIVVPRESFIAEWQASYSWGFCIISGSPAAPSPY